MSKLNDKLTRLFQELRRRKTFQAAAAYVVVGWVLIEVASVVLPAFSAPEWILPSIIIAIAVGLPIAVVVSWIFDIHFGGVERTLSLEEVAGNDTIASEKLVAAVKPSIAVPFGNARRRQVTLLRCTFELNRDGKSAADPEALHGLRERFDELIADVASHFTAVLSDKSGVTYELLFGYPTAFENDALRACAAAFSIKHRLRSIKSEQGSSTAVATVGIHSDIAVVEKSVDDDESISVVGEASQIAAWLQTLAAPGSITLSANSHHLLRDKVEAETQGLQKNLRLGTEMEIYRAVALMPHDSAATAHAASNTVMLGRDAELAMLLDRWELAKDGEDQFVLLRGDPGIGKSTLVSGLTARVREDKRLQFIPLFCSPFEINSAFHPVVEYFLGPISGTLDEETHAAQSERISRLLDQAGLDAADAESLRAELLAFVTTDSGKAAVSRTAEEARRALLRSLMEYFTAAAKQGPLLIIVEDIQWADPSTLEIIDMMMSGGASLNALSLFTARPGTEFDWVTRPDVLVLDLQRLPRRAIENLVREVAGDVELSEEMLGKIIAETDGNPLFAEELTRAMTEHGAEESGTLVLPGTVQQSLESRMDKLGSAQPLLQLCSLLGARFDYELLLAVSETENEKALQSDLRTIVNAGLLYQEGAVPHSTYRFKHMLMQETAHGTLLKKTRIKQHARIAATVESRFPEKAQRQPELLAFHYSEGGEPAKAMPYWIQACRKSLQAYAIREAYEQAESGLKVLSKLPEGAQRDALEVTLLSMRGKAMLTLRGYGDPEVEATFARALALTGELGNSPQMFQLVVGLWMYFFIAGEAEHALALARRLCKIADYAASPAKRLQSHYCRGYALFRLGRLNEALGQFELALQQEANDADFSSESASGDDTRIHLRIVLAHLLWHLGDDERSLANASEARALAAELGNPFGIVFAEFMSSWLHMLRREPAECSRYAARAIEVAEDRGFHFWLPLAYFMQSWSSCDGGKHGDDARLATRLEHMEQNLLRFVSAGASNGEVSLGLQIAEDKIACGLLDEALNWVERAERSMATSGEAFLRPDAIRIRAQLAARRGNAADAEEGLAAAQSAARDMGSVSLARRAAEDLAHFHSGAAGVAAGSDRAGLGGPAAAAKLRQD
ncbi:MAG: AAA family ATPase [Woeseia sp.]